MQARRAQAEQAVSPEAKAPEPDALVLTPALRVHEGGRADPESQPAGGDAEAQAEALVPAEIAADAPYEEAPYEEAVEEPALAAPLDLSETMGMAEAQDEAAPVEAEAAVETEAARPAQPETLEAKIAALEALISGSPESPQAAQPVEEPAADASSEAMAEVSGEETASVPEAPLAWEDHLPEAELEDAAPAEDSVETATDSSENSTEDSAPPADPFVFVSRNHHPGPEAQATPASDAAARKPTPEAPVAADMPIDEEALRDLVVDIVREELQGALGERITRNVRRLVRREIHRALASQELD